MKKLNSDRICNDSFDHKAIINIRDLDFFSVEGNAMTTIMLKEFAM